MYDLIHSLLSTPNGPPAGAAGIRHPAFKLKLKLTPAESGERARIGIHLGAEVQDEQ